ncbi:MAG: hypothetical protein Q7O04_04995 [Candidatus Omnitrophota bacterium]|nr:hypothetical protein [Candidatus Omnitrophota bacterium]
MMKFNKGYTYNLKIISIAISLAFLFNAALYSYPSSKYSLRLPLGKEDDTLTRIEDLNRRERAVQLASEAWAFIEADIKTWDPDVDKKRVPFLSRLYIALNRTFNSEDGIVAKIRKGRMDPFVMLKTRKYGEEPDNIQLHDAEREIEVGFFSTTGNPLHWGHILVTLMSQNMLDLDTVVWRIDGEVRFKYVLESDRVPAKDRHDIVKAVIGHFYPLMRYADLSTEPGNKNEGAEEMYRFLEMNQDRKLHIYYLLGVEDEPHVRRYIRQQYEFAEKNNFGINSNHKLTVGFIQRGAYGALITQEELERLGKEVRRKFAEETDKSLNDIKLLDLRVIKDPDIDLKVASTYYRNAHDPAIVPQIVDEYARAHGLYGHSPIDPRTGKPIAASEDEHFRLKLRPIAKGIVEEIIEKIKLGRQTPIISIDGGSGSGKTTIAEEVARYLKERGYQSVIIGLDMYLKNRIWRHAIQKLVTGEMLTKAEKELLDKMVQRIQKNQPYLDEEVFFDHAAITKMLQYLADFSRSSHQAHIINIPNAYIQETKELENRKFEVNKGMVVIVEGKYANEEELQPYYDLRYRLNDNPERTEAHFEMRTRKLSPYDADRQIKFYKLALVPSYEAYAARTQEQIYSLIDLTDETWRLIPLTDILVGIEVSKDIQDGRKNFRDTSGSI